MERTSNSNINTRTYWNIIYEDKAKREAYEKQGTADTPGLENYVQKDTTARFTTALKYVKNGDKVVDMGCGVGIFTTLVFDNNPVCEVWGTDISSAVIDANKELMPEIHYFQQYIGKQDKLPDNYFDVVFSGETLEHLDNPHDLFRDASRVLKAGGKLVITTPLENRINSPEHTWSFTKEDIQTLYKENNFKFIEFVELPYPEDFLVIFAVGEKCEA